MRNTLLLSLCLSLLVACGGGVSGEYGTGEGDNWTTVFTFKGGEVDVEMPFGGAVRGTYKHEDDKVAITLNGQTMIFPIDDKGCIKAGLMFGTVCKKP